MSVVDGSGEGADFREGTVKVGDLEVVLSVTGLAGGTEVHWAVRNARRHIVHLDRIGLSIAAASDRLLEHGWQSWSVVRRCTRGDTRPERGGVDGWRNAMLIADPGSAGRFVAGDQFLVDEAGVTGFLSAFSHFGTVTVAPSLGETTAWALLDGVPLSPGEERQLDPVWIAAGDPGECYSRFAELWGARSGARTGAPARPGWCSWYRYLNSVTPDDVGRAAQQCVRHGLEVVQIDDGHQAAIGEWRSPSPMWSAGAPSVARELVESGLTAGLWTAPFLMGHDTALLADHPSWVLCDERGDPVGAMHHPGLWGGWAYALDTTHPAVLDHFRSTFHGLVEDGFSYHKLDFLYAAALAGRHHARSATRAEALRLGLDAIREAVGEDSFMLGCGCPLGPAVGVVDAMRVSTDVGRWWTEPPTVGGYPETQSGLRNSVRASVLRAPLHRRLWINDPDCVLLQPGPGELSEHHRQLMLDVVAGTGGYTVLSDDLDRYTEEEWTSVERLVSARHLDTTLDLVDPFAAAPVVRSAGRQLEVDWRGEGRAVLSHSRPARTVVEVAS